MATREYLVCLAKPPYGYGKNYVKAVRADWRSKGGLNAWDLLPASCTTPKRITAATAKAAKAKFKTGGFGRFKHKRRRSR